MKAATRNRIEIRIVIAALLAIFVLLAARATRAQSIASADLTIQGVGLRVVTQAVTTGIDMPSAIQTEFGGLQNDEARSVEGLLAVGELIGPGIDEPIRLETAPGHKFQIPALSREGVYFLQNIRLMRGSEFLQPATPSIATVTVTNLLQTSVRVRQLSPEELRARGISVDARNFDVYEYTFSFIIDGKVVEIPFPVIIDPRTHEARIIKKEEEFKLPDIPNVTPPRWSPPHVAVFELEPGGELPPGPRPPAEGGGSKPTIPAALIIPNNFAVLHQFFAVTLMVTNGAPAGAEVTLDSVTGLIKPPTALRTVKSTPAVAFNQPVPIVDAATGVTFLIAQAKGEAEWVMEALKPGTHTVEVEVRATYKAPGQAEFPLRGTARTSLVVHDPRFNITFSHPDTVRKDIEYSTYSFITNMSAASQTVRVTTDVPSCVQAPGVNVCQVAPAPEFHQLTLAPGETQTIEYRLKPGITGYVSATAGTVSEELSASVQLHMGVSESGIPLSPATLVMPYYARYADPDLVSANLQLLGLGYSLATAPLTKSLAKFPRVIKTDIFSRAVDIAHAGQRIFLEDSPNDSYPHMALELLGNSSELREWDELRRGEKSGRKAGAAVTRVLEKGALAPATLGSFVDNFAAVTAWRGPYTLALAHGTGGGDAARPYAVSLRGVTSKRRADIPNEAENGWVRDLPFADISRFAPVGSSDRGELALIGRWTEQVEVNVTPAADGPFEIELVLPSAETGTVRRVHLNVANGHANETLTITIDKGLDTAEARTSAGAIAATATATVIQPQPLKMVGVVQDLNLDEQGHRVAVLFNRPVALPAGGDLRALVSAEVILNRDGVNYRGPRPIPGAALQEEGRTIYVNFDHALSKNVEYDFTMQPLVDPISNTPWAFTPATKRITIYNDAPGALIFGHVLKADNTPIGNAEVRLFANSAAPQYDLSAASDGSFLFEFVPRNPEARITGEYTLEAVTVERKATSVAGAVRLPGRVHFVNLVFLGRGSAEGYVRYNDGTPVPDAAVTIGSVMFNQFRSGKADANGFYHIDDLPVGPITFAATDASNNITYAANELKTPGQVLTQDLSIFRRPFPGTGTIRVLIKRSDTNQPVTNAHVGAYSQGFALQDGYTDAQGRFEFAKVPAGFVTVLASEWSISLEPVAVDFDLAADEVKDLTLIINIRPPEVLVPLEGTVWRENPLFPGDSSKYERVPGALVKVGKGQVVTADADGHYTYQPIPVSWGGTGTIIQAYDPQSGRTSDTVIPAIDPNVSPKILNLFILTADGFGKGTIRVRLIDAAGNPVSGYRVMEPGFPPTLYGQNGPGIYERSGVPVGGSHGVWAIAQGDGAYGSQVAVGSAKVEFNGHVASVTLRLPGQGLVRVALKSDIDVIGDVKITYPAWDEAEQEMGTKTVTVSTNNNGLAGFATFTKVPALGQYTVASAHPVYGYAAQSGKLAFDGDVQSITLNLAKLAVVRGVVYEIDGRTPVPNAAVRIEDGKQNQGLQFTKIDGSYEFKNVAAGVGFRVIAEITRDGVFRTGLATGSTPALGGPVDNVAVLLRTQGSVEGRIVYAGYKVYDPRNPQNNVLDTTPNDPSDNAPVPLAKFSLREFEFPGRSFGTLVDPLNADVNGRFKINNVFSGPLRITASDPNNQETRGSWAGTLVQEGEEVVAYVTIGAEGFGPVVVRVVDPNNQNQPVLNAEVALFRGINTFDFGTTDAAGTITFEQVPVGQYSIRAFSKALGRSGASNTFTVAPFDGAEVMVSLEFSGRVTGRLTDPEAGGRGVPGAHITLYAFNYQTRTTTDVDGNFVFEGVREGEFRLDAKDTLSNRRASATRTLTKANPAPDVQLELEPTEMLFVGVYLPADDGSNSGILAPIVNIDVTQRCVPQCDYLRSQQGNDFRMPGLFKLSPYSIVVREVGGQQREIRTGNSFPKGSAADPLKLVLPAFGDVIVKVTQAGAPSADARVTVYGNGRSTIVSTDATGTAIARNLPLGPVYAQARSFDNIFSGSNNGTLASQSTPPVINIDLGAYAGISGLVEAEKGGPSVGTRVQARFANRLLVIFTDSTGRYTFQGIPTGINVDLTYFEVDDSTVGATRSVNVGVAYASQILEMATVRLDGTPPRLITMVPADNATDVSPDATLRFVFSEPIASNYINTNFFQLIPTDTSQQVNLSFTTSTAPDGTFTVIATAPPPPAGQRYPLKSTTLYRVIVSGSITDLTGNRMITTRGASFITSDYAEPRVLKVLPSPTTPLPAQTTFEFRFNEPIDTTAWQSGGNGVFHFYKTAAIGPASAVVAEKPGRVFLDPASPLSLFFAPDEPLEAQSFYRVVFTGIRDLQGNVLGQQQFDFFSFDLVIPFVKLVSPVPENLPLITGVDYTLGTDIRNGDANGTPATDIARVDFFLVNGELVTFLKSVTAAPFNLRFVGPDLGANGGTYSLRAVAFDFSTNESAPATMSWNVQPNRPPQNVAMALSPGEQIYAGNKLTGTVSFDDEGVFVSVNVRFDGIRSDGIEFIKTEARDVKRNSVADPWPQPVFTVDLPSNLAEGSPATFSATVNDVRGQNAKVTKNITILADTVAPTYLSTSPAAGTQYHFRNTYEIVAVVKDAEAGIADVTFEYDGKKIVVPITHATLVKPGPEARSWRVSSGTITVPNRSVDQTIPLVITARDFHGNATTQTIEIVYIHEPDSTAPNAAWLCPIAGAALPAAKTLPVTLKVRATDDVAVTAVRFTLPGSDIPVDAAREGTTDVWSKTLSLTTPSAGTTFLLTATISDGDPEHDLSLPILVDLVTIDTDLPNIEQAVTSGNVSQYEGKSIYLHGTGAKLVLHVPLRVKNLIVLDKAIVQSFFTTTTKELKVDLTVSDRLYVDCDSSFDVSGRGYAGGWALDQDGSNVRNNDARGRTLGNTAVGGPEPGASASYGGIGGERSGKKSNAAYGSLTTPFELGSGGGGNTNCCGNAGGNGGGAIRILAGNGTTDLGIFAIAGKVRADGIAGNGVNSNAGSGGSVQIRAKQLLLGAGAVISANGGDNDAVDSAASNQTWITSSGGGGGRIAVYATDKMDIGKLGLQLQSRGGRNGPNEGRSWIDGGPGTVYVMRPGQALGELFIGSYDDRNTTTTHLSRYTPIGWIGGGTSTAVGASSLTDTTRTFDRLAIGQELVIGANTTNTFTVTGVSADGKTLQTDPADGDVAAAAAGQSVAYSGLVRFDRIEAGARTLIRFDDSFATGDAIDDKSKTFSDPTGIIVTRSDLPSAVVTSTPAVGSQLRQNTSLSATYTASSPALLATLQARWTFSANPISTPTLTSYPLTFNQTQAINLSIPVDATPGPAAITFTITDRAGRTITNFAAANYTIVADTSPVIEKFDVNPASLSLYPGGSVVSTVSVRDDVKVSKLVFTSQLGPATPVVDTKTPNVPAVLDQQYTQAIPITTPGNTTLTLEVSAEDGYAGHLPTKQTKIVTVLKDTIAPAVTITEPAADQLYNEGSGNTITIKATLTDAEVGVKEAFARIADGALVAMTRVGTTSTWQVTVPVPAVDGTTVVTRDVFVVAKDYEGNALDPTPKVTIRIQPVDDSNSPSVRWTCSSPGAMYPPLYPVKLRLFAIGNTAGNAANGVQKVELFINGATTPQLATAVSGATDQYEVIYTIPSTTADGTVIPVRAVVTNFAGNSTEVTTSLTAVTGDVISTSTTISASTTTFDNRTVIVQNATLTIAGAHPFARLVVLDGGKVVHPATDSSTAQKLALTVSGDVYVSCLGSIDATGLGYAGSAASSGRTWPNTTIGGSRGGSGGSHGGRGGQFDASNDSAPSYGSVFDPDTPGGAGGNTTNCGACSAGGGIIRLSAAKLVLDGKLLANGKTDNNAPGAGGSIRIDAATLTGIGELRADGATGTTGGGGGRIALYVGTLSLDPARISAAGGLVAGNTSRTGAPGTIYRKQPAQANGDLIVDNLGSATSRVTTLTGVGYATTTSVAASSVTDANANFAQPNVLRGIRLIVNYDRNTTWPITANDAKTLTVDTTAAALVAQTGQALRGLYRFDTIKLRNAKIETIDFLESVAPIDSDTGSSVAGQNANAPIIDRAKVSLTASAGGSSITATAGAVTDPETPITVTATNTRTGNTFVKTANADGSFVIAVQGEAGDSITLKARDSHALYPAESIPYVVGQLTTGTPTQTQLDKAAWTTDTNFRPRTLSQDGRYLAVASFPTTNGGSDKLVILDVRDAARPVLVRTIPMNASSITDVQVVDGWAYVTADAFVTVDLANPTASPNITNDQCGNELAVAVAGGYAFAAEGNCQGDGLVRVYDVSTPSQPRLQREWRFDNDQGVNFTDLLAYGSDYLIAVSPNAGRDVTVIDRRDITNQNMISRLDIPSFDPFRGRLYGNRLFLVSRTQPEVVVVDLTNPAAPVVAGRVTVDAIGGGVSVVENDAFAAIGAPGLASLNVANATPQVIGNVPTGGTAFDVTVFSNYAYVANEIGLAIIPVQTAPQINASRIKLDLSGTSVAVTGTAQSVTGAAPLTIEAKNVTSNVVQSGVPVQSDGSFSATLAAAPGDVITVKATDAASRNAGPVTVGQVPFGSAARVFGVPNELSDANFRARRVATEGNLLTLSSYPSGTANASNKLVVYDVSDPSLPQYRRTVTTNNGTLFDVAISDGWAFIAGDAFGALNLRDASATTILVNDQCGDERAVAVAGGYAFTAEGSCQGDGMIRVYDVSTPSQPRLIKENRLFNDQSVTFTDVLTFGSDYLIAMTFDNIGGVPRDVIVIDRRDVFNMKVVGTPLVIPEIDGFRGRVDGNMLYVAGRDGGVAIVDLTNPAAPTYRVLNTPGFARGVDSAGSLVAVADGGTGVTFIDPFAAAGPRITGTQFVGGTTWDVAMNRDTLYAATEVGLAVVDHLGTPPLINTALLSITTDRSSQATLSGIADSVTGYGPMVYEAANATTGATISGRSIAADGSFSVTLPASPGDRMTLKVTDAAGRVTGPVSAGVVPFGSAARSQPITVGMTDVNFRARRVVVEGSILAVASYPASATGSSNKLAVYNAANPANPVYSRTVDGGVGTIFDVEIVDGWAMIAGDAFGTLDLKNPSATPTAINDQCGDERAVAVSHGYAFTAEGNCQGDGMIRVYDVSTPSAPRLIKENRLYNDQGITFTDVVTMGTDYLVAIGPAGKDVTIVDRRDVLNLRILRTIDIPQIASFRARVIGTTLYVAGDDGGVALLDLTDIAAAQPIIVNTPGIARGVDAAGTTLAVADGATGVTFVEATASPRIIGSQLTGGTAWDLMMNRDVLYVANETGLSVIDSLSIPPTVNAALLSMTTDGATQVTVTGAANSIAGLAPLSVTVRNTRSGQTSTVSVRADGSFDAPLTGSAGDTVTLTATDGAGRTAGPIVVGQVPFGAAARTTAITLPMVANDASFRARGLAVEGKYLGVISHPEFSSNKIVVFDVTNPVAPVYSRTINTNDGALWDITIADGWAYFTGDAFGTIDLKNPSSTATLTNDQCGDERAVAVSGGLAFTAEGSCQGDGLIRVYDVANPAAPRILNEHRMYNDQGVTFTDLLAYGTDYLIAVTPSKIGGAGKDVTVIDRRDFNRLIKVAELDIPQIDAFRGRVAGKTLYVAGADGGVAVVDLANPASPTYAVVDTPGFTRAVDVAGTMVAVADEGTGITFVDASNVAAPTVIGVQATGGTAWDVALHQGMLYAANEQGLSVIANVAVPPMIDAARIAVTTDGATTATVTASPGALSGIAPLTYSVTNSDTTATTATAGANSDGSFSTTIAARPGQRLEVKSTDKAGRQSVRAIGAVPFANVVRTDLATSAQALGDANYRARRISVDGSRAVLTTGSVWNVSVPRADKYLFVQSNASAAPTFVSGNAGGGTLDDVEVRGNYAYVVGDALSVVNLANTPITFAASNDNCGREGSVVVDGNFAYTAETDCQGDGLIYVHNISSPTAPANVGTFRFYNDQGRQFSALFLLGTRYLVGVDSGTGAKDLTIVDHQNPLALAKVSDLDVANFNAIDGVADGNFLYLVGDDAGVAIIDATNPSAPVLRSVINTPGRARAVAAYSSTEIIVADAGGPGLTFIDVTDKANPVILGSQKLPGNPTDLRVVGKTIHVAGENYYHVLTRP